MSDITMTVYSFNFLCINVDKGGSVLSEKEIELVIHNVCTD